MNLNGWQRIGVVASVLWAVGAAIYVRIGQVSKANEFYASALENCMPEFAKTCTDKAGESYRSILSLHFVSVSDIVFSAIGPVLAGWTVAFITLKVARWVKAGF